MFLSLHALIFLVMKFHTIEFFVSIVITNKQTMRVNLQSRYPKKSQAQDLNIYRHNTWGILERTTSSTRWALS